MSWGRLQDVLEDEKLLRWRRYEDVFKTNRCLLVSLIIFFVVSIANNHWFKPFEIRFIKSIHELAMVAKSSFNSVCFLKEIWFVCQKKSIVELWNLAYKTFPNSSKPPRVCLYLSLPLSRNCSLLTPHLENYHRV